MKILILKLKYSISYDFKVNLNIFEQMMILVEAVYLLDEFLILILFEFIFLILYLNLMTKVLFSLILYPYLINSSHSTSSISKNHSLNIFLSKIDLIVFNSFLQFILHFFKFNFRCNNFQLEIGYYQILNLNDHLNLSLNFNPYLDWS